MAWFVSERRRFHRQPERQPALSGASLPLVAPVSRSGSRLTLRPVRAYVPCETLDDKHQKCVDHWQK